MLLLIDNYDSFTHNLARYFRELNQSVRVVRNDAISLDAIEQCRPDYLVISPGPCSPNEAGISLAAVEHFAGRIPILGVCLGHQSIGQVFGAQVVRARQVMHGKVSKVYHDNQSLLQGLDSPFIATRYHSLVLAPDSIPDELEVLAWTEQDGEPEEVMALRHKHWPICGVQFHPESVLTGAGHQLLANFLRLYSS